MGRKQDIVYFLPFAGDCGASPRRRSRLAPSGEPVAKPIQIMSVFCPAIERHNCHKFYLFGESGAAALAVAIFSGGSTVTDPSVDQPSPKDN
jgi:hypothetical protein